MSRIKVTNTDGPIFCKRCRDERAMLVNDYCVDCLEIILVEHAKLETAFNAIGDALCPVELDAVSLVQSPTGRALAAIESLKSRLATTTAALEAAQKRADDLLDVRVTDDEDMRWPDELRKAVKVLEDEYDVELYSHKFLMEWVARCEGVERQFADARAEREQEASAHRATTRELEGARASLADHDAIITRYDSDLKAARAQNAVTLWVCPECLFGFDASHDNGDGKYTCPACEEDHLREKLATATAILDRLCELAKGVRVEGDDGMVETFERVIEGHAGLEAALAWLVTAVIADHEIAVTPDKDAWMRRARECGRMWLRWRAEDTASIETLAAERDAAIHRAASVGQAVKRDALTIATDFLAMDHAEFHDVYGVFDVDDALQTIDVDAIIATVNQPLVALGAEGDEDER